MAEKIARLPKHEIAVTGCGWVTPCAAGAVDDVMAHVAELTSTTAKDKQNGNKRAGCAEVPADLLNAGPDLPPELTSDHASFIAGRAALTALADAGIDTADVDADRIGISVASGLAGQQAMITFASEVREQSVRFVSPIHFPQTVGNYVGGALARSLHLRGPNLTLAGGSLCGMAAVISACRILAEGDADAMVAGGFESLTPVLVNAFDEPPSISAEGACFVVLESRAAAERRGAPIRAVIREWKESVAFPSPSSVKGVVCAYRHSLPESVVVERIIGRCDGASGAALIAAALAVAKGHEIPVTDPSGCEVRLRRLAPSAQATSSTCDALFTLFARAPNGTVHLAGLSVRSGGIPS